MCNYVIYYPGEATAGAAVEGEPSNHQLWQKDKRQKTKDKKDERQKTKAYF